MSRRIKKVVSKDLSSKVSGLDKIHLGIMRSLTKTKQIFQKLKINREKKEKEFLFSEKPQSEIDKEVKRITDKLKNNENMFKKISKQLTLQSELFSKKIARFQEVMKGLVIKNSLPEFAPPPIDGDMTVNDIEHFLETLYENYGAMQEQYAKTKDESYLEMAMDTQLAIQEINEIKGYLMERGRYDKDLDYSAL
ncbi:MAG: hypothetical protein ACTSO9_15930 [Candidatus Helarchaeota archaeon]